MRGEVWGHSEADERRKVREKPAAVEEEPDVVEEGMGRLEVDKEV